MAILIDPPAWPAHGTLWSHLVSDSDYEELHAFAARLAIPRRGFDLDHYDVPASIHGKAVELGARPVSARDIVFRLRDSGLRVRQLDRAATYPVRRRQYLLAEWAALAAAAGIGASDQEHERWDRLGRELIARWNEEHRSYHDERHLEDVLLSLNQLATRGERISSATLLAAWFHDAVYAGEPGADERDSARLATQHLGEQGLDATVVQQVGELIVATDPASDSSRVPPHLGHLLDADLSIFAAGDTRYSEYQTAVRAEYAHVAEDAFREGRARILTSYLDRPEIYLTGTARELWEDRARANLSREIAFLDGTKEHARDSGAAGHVPPN